jgi:hypothetical protein
MRTTCPEFRNGSCQAFIDGALPDKACRLPENFRGPCPIYAVRCQTRSWAQEYGNYTKMVAEIAKKVA